MDPRPLTWNNVLRRTMGLVNDLSLIVVAGTTITFLYFARRADLQDHTVLALALALSVWIIYTLDHLRDGWRHKRDSPMRRHRLHFEYRWLFAASVGFAALGLFWMIACCIHRNWTYFGLAVGMAILGYMALNNALFSRLGKNLPFKEAGIALTVTVCLAAAPLSTDGMVAHEWIQIALFLCINLINLLQFSYFDRVHDRKAGFASLTAYLESETLRRAIGGVLLVASVFLVALASMRDSSVFILGAMWVVLGLIHLSPGFFAGHDRYRFWGDLIYCFPLLEVIFS